MGKGVEQVRASELERIGHRRHRALGARSGNAGRGEEGSHVQHHGVHGERSAERVEGQEDEGGHNKQGGVRVRYDGRGGPTASRLDPRLVIVRDGQDQGHIGVPRRLRLADCLLQKGQETVSFRRSSVFRRLHGVQQSGRAGSVDASFLLRGLDPRTHHRVPETGQASPLRVHDPRPSQRLVQAQRGNAPLLPARLPPNGCR